VGTAKQCTPSPAGSNIVTSAWLRGMGLPDNGGRNTQSVPPGVTNAPVEPNNPNRRDPHTGPLMSKNRPTSDCSSAEARIEGWKKGDTVTELGFDFRNGGHCGAGAPRFDVTVTGSDGTSHTFFFGCVYGAHTDAPQDPTQWTRVRFDATVCPAAGDPCQLGGFVFGPSGTKVDRIDVVYDEGTDTPSTGQPRPIVPPSGEGDPNGVGLAVLDNIDVNGNIITAGSGVCPGSGGDDGSCPSSGTKGEHDRRNHDRDR